MLTRTLLIVVLLFTSLTTETTAARRCGVIARRRAARIECRCRYHLTRQQYATPQAAFDAYCRAVVGRDWGAFYDVMSRESQDIELVQVALRWLYFVVDSYREDADPYPEWDEFQRWHGLKHREWLRKAIEIDEKDGISSLNFFPDRKPLSRSECNEMVKPLRAQLRDRRAFYVASMQNFWPISEREGDMERAQTLARRIDFPPIRNITYSGRHARGIVTPSKTYAIHFSNDVPDQPVAFTFERGGWRIEIAPQ